MFWPNLLSRFLGLIFDLEKVIIWTSINKIVALSENFMLEF